MHCNTRTIRIGTQQSVYGDWPAGILEKQAFFEGLFVPHQQGFHSDGHARLPIAVHGQPALAPEECIVVRRVPTLGHSTAVATPFGGVVGIHDREPDVLVETPTFEVLFEHEERNPKDFSVESFSFGFEPLEILDGDVGIVFDSKICNVSHDLPDPILHEVMLPGLEPLDTSSGSVAPLVSKALEFRSSFHHLYSLHPNVLPEVELFENLAVRGEDGGGKTLAVHVDPDHVVPAFSCAFLGEKSHNLSVARQTVGFARPARPNQIVIPLKVAISQYRNGNPFSGIQTEFHEEPAFCTKCFAVSWNVELDGDCPDAFSLAANDVALDIAYHLTVEGGISLAG